MRWASGEAAVERLLAEGRLERVQGAQADGGSSSQPPLPGSDHDKKAEWM